jgi:heat shock protein HslJ
MSIRAVLASLPFVLLAQACSGISTKRVIPLEDIPWNLVSQDGVAIEPGSRSRAPEILLSGRDKRLGGSGGCNRLMGSYELDGDKLSFGPLVATRMACAAGMAEEAGFTTLLQGVVSWRVDGSQLVLFDGAGRAVLRFEARKAL